MSAARPETGATLTQIGKAKDALIRQRFGLSSTDSMQSSNVPLWQINKADDQVDAVAPHLVKPTHLIIPRAYLDALETLLDAGCSVGVADGRWAREGLWQNAENEKDAARGEMGL